MITDVQIMMFLVCIANIIFISYIWWNRNEKIYIVISLILIAFLLEFVIENWGSEIVRVKMEPRDITILSVPLLANFYVYKKIGILSRCGLINS